MKMFQFNQFRGKQKSSHIIILKPEISFLPNAKRMQMENKSSNNLKFLITKQKKLEHLHAG